jgi:hypothetical protein
MAIKIQGLLFLREEGEVYQHTSRKAKSHSEPMYQNVWGVI